MRRAGRHGAVVAVWDASPTVSTDSRSQLIDEAMGVLRRRCKCTAESRGDRSDRYAAVAYSVRLTTERTQSHTPCEIGALVLSRPDGQRRVDTIEGADAVWAMAACWSTGRSHFVVLIATREPKERIS